MYLQSGTRRSSRLQMLWSVLLQVRQIQPVQFQHHPSRVIIRSLGEDPEDGTAYVFTSKDQKIVKIIRHEHNECQMYYQKFDKNMSFVRLEFEGVLPIYVLEWKYLVAMLSCPVVKSIGPIELKCYEKAA